MDLFEIIFSVIIAIYIVISSAFVNAAIVSPRNCLILLGNLSEEIKIWFIVGLALIILAFTGYSAGLFPIGNIAGLVLIGMAHVAWYLVYLICKMFAGIIERGIKDCEDNKKNPRDH